MDSLKKDNQLVRWIVVGLCAVSFFVLKYFSPTLITSLFEKSSFDLLNQVTRVEANQPLGFYLGRIEEIVYGPLMMVFSGLVLLILSLTNFKSCSMRTYTFIVFAYLLLTRPEVLLYPPYGDAIGGPFAEAIWLARHNFDYAQLAQQPDYISGGPKVYLFSIYPTYLALLIKLIPNVKMFLVINHLIVFVLASMIVGLFRKICLKQFDEKIANLLAVLLVSLPLFQSQVEAVNMEIPTVFFGMLSIVALTERKVPSAALWAIVATMVKGYALVVCGTVFFVSVLLFFWDENKQWNFKTLGWGVSCVLFVLVKSYAAFFILSEEGNVDMVGPFQGWPSLKIFGITYSYIFSLAIFLGLLAQEAFLKRQKIQKIINTYYVEIIMFTVAGAWFFLFLHSYSVSPRYRMILLPFLIFSIYYIIQIFLRNEKGRIILIFGFCVFYFLSAYGLMDKPMKENDHVLLERSLEYRNDLKANIQATKLLERKYYAFTISAPQNVAQQLALPELGYVVKDLDVMIYGFVCTYADVKRFSGLKNIDVRKTIWVGVQAIHENFPNYPIWEKYDRIQEELVVGNKKVMVFFGGFGVEMMRKSLEDFKRKMIRNIVENPEKYQRSFQFKDKQSLEKARELLKHEDAVR